MKICESTNECAIEDCPHKQIHDEFNDRNVERPNICSAPCDVSGGVARAICVDVAS